jgi:Family of unknown function (DUF6325)
MSKIGPVEYMIVAFPGNNFRGEIAPAIAELADSGTIRIIDLGFISKDSQGKVTAAEMQDRQSAAGLAFQTIEAEIGELLNEDDLNTIGQELEPESSAAVLVWEDVWATKLKSAIQDAGGVLVEIERIPYQVVDEALAYAGFGENGTAS